MKDEDLDFDQIQKYELIFTSDLLQVLKKTIYKDGKVNKAAIAGGLCACANCMVVMSNASFPKEEVPDMISRTVNRAIDGIGKTRMGGGGWPR